MKMLLVNTKEGLQPIFDEDKRKKQSLKLGETYTAEVIHPRNSAFHRKFFALIQLGYDNTRLELPYDAYLDIMIIKAGFFDAYNTGKGVYYKRKSIAFANMDEETFQDVYNRVRNQISKDIGATSEEIDNELSNFY